MPNYLMVPANFILLVIVKGLNKGRWGVRVKVTYSILYPFYTLTLKEGTQIPLKFLRGKTFLT